ncbi:hypothetical protein [Desulfonatronospira sp.]|uniref:hypothetical protein n=1 Tax=Desulfonatronospira sp. TaxID=1962951 RepID=UPI0025BFB6CB|nr:hypothetical protein [Desulfonatronospira sp.]
MEKNPIQLYTSDGEKSDIKLIGNIKFNREQLLINIHTSDGITGIHWDHMACIIQDVYQANQPSRIKQCEIALFFSDGHEIIVIIDNFQSVEIKMANSLMIIRGTKQTAMINPDFFKWYRVKEDATAKSLISSRSSVTV